MLSHVIWVAEITRIMVSIKRSIKIGFLINFVWFFIYSEYMYINAEYLWSTPLIFKHAIAHLSKNWLFNDFTLKIPICFIFFDSSFQIYPTWSLIVRESLLIYYKASYVISWKWFSRSNRLFLFKNDSVSLFMNWSLNSSFN